MEDQIEGNGAAPCGTAASMPDQLALQEAVNNVCTIFQKRLALVKNIDIGQVDIRAALATEHVQVLTALLVDLGAISEKEMTLRLTRAFNKLAENIRDQPVIVPGAAVPRSDLRGKAPRNN